MAQNNDPQVTPRARIAPALEILAPAGGMDALIAAVRCGADAVYLGLSGLNARQGATNFSLDPRDEATDGHLPLGERTSLAEAVRYCHLCGVKVYLTLNTLLFDAEFLQLQEMVDVACAAPVDGIIVQDLGVLFALRQWCPTMPLHASTQMTVHTSLGVRALHELGFSRVVLARELSAVQVAQIQAETEELSIETELFVHGALCVSVSGQCYMSALIGGRSANKGSCAGSCRLPFLSCRGNAPGESSPGEAYALSLKDNCLVTHGQVLAELGVTSLKIEGRMKRAEYVAATVDAYRRMREGDPVDLARLRAVFSRDGFTDRYFTGEIDHAGGELFGVRSKQDVPPEMNAIYRDLRGLYHKEIARHPVTMQFRLVAHQPATLTLTATTARGDYSVTVGGELPSLAHTTPLTLSLAEQTLGKFGGTVFYLAEFRGEIDPSCTLKKSQLTALRRQAVTELSEQMSVWEPVPCTVTPLLLSREQASPAERGATQVRFASVAQMKISPDLLAKVTYFSLPLDQVVKHRKTLLRYRDKLLIEPDRVMFGREREISESLTSLAEDGFRHLAVSNIAHIEIGKRLQLRLFGSAFLNVTNSYSAEMYREMGLYQLELSFEARGRQLRQIAESHGDFPLGVIAYGHLPMMVLRSCPLWQNGTDSCGDCDGTGRLIDRKGEQLLLLCHQKRYRELLNPRVLWLSDQDSLWQSLQFATLYFTVETAGQCGEVLLAHLAGEPPKAEIPFTRGLYHRGIS